jgi:hypothetical protein
MPRETPQAPAMWIRLDPPVAARAVGVVTPGAKPRTGAAEGTVGRARDDSTAGVAAVRRVFGCRWLWWTADPERAWQAALRGVGVGAGDRVVAPAGLDSVATRMIARAGADVLEVDLDPDTGYPVWGDAGRTAAAVVLDHRYGRPQPPPALGTAAVLEDATDAVGAAAGGRPVGALGAAMVCVLGRPPFGRSTGALVGTNAQEVAAAVASDLTALVAVDGPAADGGADTYGAVVALGALWDDAAGVGDWVEACRAAADVYSSAWRGARLPVYPLPAATGTAPSWSAYLAVVPNPDDVVRMLARRGVEASQPAPGRCPASVVRLPNHPGLGLGELLYVADAVGLSVQGWAGSAGGRPGAPVGGTGAR